MGFDAPRLPWLPRFTTCSHRAGGYLFCIALGQLWRGSLSVVSSFNYGRASHLAFSRGLQPCDRHQVHNAGRLVKSSSARESHLKHSVHSVRRAARARQRPSAAQQSCPGACRERYTRSFLLLTSDNRRKILFLYGTQLVTLFQAVWAPEGSCLQIVNFVYCPHWSLSLP